MNLSEYEKQFQEILDGHNNSYPYDSDDYVNYVKMNQARMNRWKKRGKIAPELVEMIKNIDQPQNWLLITEPWCGDAAHSHPFIGKLAELNSNITLTVQNRDAADSEIDQYLTNGGKSIPILVVRDADGNDLFHWGPRPKEAQAMVMSQKTNTVMSDDDKKQEIQKWYNKDKGQNILEDLTRLLLENVSDSTLL